VAWFDWQNCGRGDPVQYLMAFGALHICVRLHVMLNTRDNSLWRQSALGWPEERPDVSLEAISRTCRRGVRWASNSSLTEPLSEWLFALPDLVQAQPHPKAAAAGYPEGSTVH
jgi:hypothetical protein